MKCLLAAIPVTGSTSLHLARCKDVLTIRDIAAVRGFMAGISNARNSFIAWAWMI